MARKRLPAGTAPHVANIVAVYRAATDRQVRDGIEWYARAHALALVLDPENVERAAGVISALSPRCPWERNVTLAVRAYAEGRASGTTVANVRKANKILSGEWNNARAFAPPRARKTRNFAGVIADPTDPHAVVVDRHAFDVAVGRVTDDETRAGLLASAAYERYADAYRAAARLLGVSPSQVQAVTWVAWREGVRP